MTKSEFRSAKSAAAAAAELAFDALIAEIAERWPSKNPFTVAERLEFAGTQGTPFAAAYARLAQRNAVEHAIVERWRATSGLSFL